VLGLDDGGATLGDGEVLVVLDVGGVDPELAGLLGREVGALGDLVLRLFVAVLAAEEEPEGDAAGEGEARDDLRGPSEGVQLES
jgi:hypothetical protein